MLLTKRKLFSLTLCLLATTLGATANTHKKNHGFWQKTKGNYYVGAQAGFNYDAINADDVIESPVPGTDPQRYNTNGGNKYSFSGGLRAGLTTLFNQTWSLQWGFAYYASLPQKLTGEYFARNTQPVDLTYQYNLFVQRAVFEARAFYHQNTKWSYFAGLDVGLAILHTTKPNFKTIVYPGGALTPLDSNSKTKTSLAYGASMGVDYCIHNHWHVSVGLTQSWLGKAKLSVNNGAANILVNGGTVNPLQAWIGSHYQF